MILKGGKVDHKLHLYISKECWHLINEVPDFFTMEIDLNKIKERKKFSHTVQQKDIYKITELLECEQKPLSRKFIRSKCQISLVKVREVLKILISHGKARIVGDEYEWVNKE